MIFKKKPVSKLDDSDWHEESGVSAEQSAVHISFYFCWLVESGFMTEDAMNQLDLSNPLDRSVSPSTYLIDNCDGKLMIEDQVPQAKAFSAHYYGNQYYTDFYEIKGFDLDIKTSSSYNIRDTWPNQALTAKMLSDKYQQFNV